MGEEQRMISGGNARKTTLTLLAERDAHGTICPSEVARALDCSEGAPPVADQWRKAMPAVHKAVDQLVSEGVVQLSWKGKLLPTRNGPYRIGRAR